MIENSKDEALILMQEECAEVIQIISKIKRWGEESHNPDDPNKKTARDRLIQELGDLSFVLIMLKNQMGITDEQIGLACAEKAIRMIQYTQFLKYDVLRMIPDKGA